ncbi:MAG: DUF1611 domain-containing protein [Dehalococcoidia bacterium]|nr:MAG: DUF1611 domain-containing protein [Dehalococcoidia bacterium]
MSPFPEGNAIVYCRGAFGTTYGKTAHGLVRKTDRYRVLSVVADTLAEKDAGNIIGGTPSDIPIFPDIPGAVAASRKTPYPASHLVIGLATDGGYISNEVKVDIAHAITLGLSIDSGLHEFLTENDTLAALARQFGVTLRDVRKPPPRKELHFFSGKIAEVTSFIVAVLGTDSAVGKRTTAWLLIDALVRQGYTAQFIGTGQTAWMQGAEYGIIMDSLINDFVAGEIEHVVWKAWNEKRPDIIVIEGQGSLMNPAYPGGFEILAAGRPGAVILQHAPARTEYDGFPGYPLHSIERQVQAVELLSGRPVIAVTVNHEGMSIGDIPAVCSEITEKTGLPATDVLVQGADRAAGAVIEHLTKREACLK